MLKRRCKRNYHKLMIKLCGIYNITSLKFIDSCNNYIAGGDWIYIGKLNSPEIQFISFLHEVGHSLITFNIKSALSYATYPIEWLAWRFAFLYADHNNISFSKKCLDYVNECLSEYEGHDVRECSHWKRKSELKALNKMLTMTNIFKSMKDFKRLEIDKLKIYMNRKSLSEIKSLFAFSKNSIIL